MLYRNPLISENDKLQNGVIKLHCPCSQVLSYTVFSLITFFMSWRTTMILISSSHTGYKSRGTWKRHCQQYYPCLDCRFSCSPNLATAGERLSTHSPYTQQGNDKRERWIIKANPWWNLPCLENPAGQRALASPSDAPKVQQPKAETFQDFLQKSGCFQERRRAGNEPFPNYKSEDRKMALSKQEVRKQTCNSIKKWGILGNFLI